MAKSDLETIIGLGIAGVGAYWIWSSGLLNSLFTPAVAAAAPAGGVIPASTPPPTSTSIVPVPVTQTPAAPSTPPATPPATPMLSSTPGNATLAAQIQQLAGTADPLTPDQWNYYYNQIMATRAAVMAQDGVPGGAATALTGTQFEAVLAALGLTDATRATPVSLGQFVNALTAQGLSGLNALHYRRVRYSSPARYAGGQYHMSNNTSPQGRL
jgi:hypothetical protein